MHGHDTRHPRYESREKLGIRPALELAREPDFASLDAYVETLVFDPAGCAPRRNDDVALVT
jgi:hypothetical protein